MIISEINCGLGKKFFQYAAQAKQSCKYHVIAYSSFSWWTAWLSAHPDKKMVAPNNWFKKANKIQ